MKIFCLIVVLLFIVIGFMSNFINWDKSGKGWDKSGKGWDKSGKGWDKSGKGCPL